MLRQVLKGPCSLSPLAVAVWMVVVALAAKGAVAISPAEKQGPFSVEFLGRVELPGNAVDRSGLITPLEDGSPANRLGGFSAIEYSGQDDRFVLLADRGAGDGAVSFACRLQLVDLQVDPQTKSVSVKWDSTQLLTAGDNQPLVGSLSTWADDRKVPSNKLWHAMDPEGIRRWNGGYLISDEYGPHVARFDGMGHLTDQWLLPPSRQCRGGVGNGSEDVAGSNIGSCNNRGLEGLAVTPSGESIWVAYQSCLLQDGVMDGWNCLGNHARWIKFDADGNRIAEVAYPMESRKTGISEILAIDEQRFLAIERDGKIGDEVENKDVFIVDIADATDISGIESLSPDGNLGGIKPVKKTKLIDLTDPIFGFGKSAAAEKPEGLAWGRQLADGRRTLWICWDNDFDPDRPSTIACFAIGL